MARLGEVHWHEGLFLQPHHLQTMQRHLLDEVARSHRLDWAYPYGLVESRLSTDALENMLVQFDRLRVIMPSGLEVTVPDNTALPALDIKKAFAAQGSVLVLLGVPLWYATRANAVTSEGDADWRVKRLFRTTEVERPDENTGENPQPVPLRQINARLLLETDDRSDLEVLPLVRVVAAAGDEVGLPRQDPRFIPPCLVIHGSPPLREMIRDLANQVEASRSELISQLGRGGFAIEALRGVQFEQIWRLRTLSRYGARLPSLIQTPNASPFTLYLELRELLAELTALHPDRDPGAAAAYNHDAPGAAFTELSGRIRDLLRGAVTPSFQRVKFVREGGLLTATLTAEQLEHPNDYFLGITTRQDPKAVASLVEDPDQFKFMAQSMAERAIWGVKLTEERHPPLELPAQTGLHYFRLERGESQRMWQQIKKEKAVAIRWPDVASSDFDISLYMTLPPGSESS